MAKRDDIVSYAETLLNSRGIVDEWCENGLQISGAEEARKIALGVSTTLTFLQAAKKWGADMCLVHHGLFWRKGPLQIEGVLKERLKIILENNLSLVNFHIPLDAHAEIGNNVLLIKMLGLKKLAPVACGFLAATKKQMSFNDFSDLVQKKIGRINFAQNFSGKPVQKIGVVSGGAASFAPEIKAAGADTFLFGEISEHDYHDLKDMKLSFIAAGHFATERYGVQALGEKITEKFPDVTVQFFDEDCPV